MRLRHEQVSNHGIIGRKSGKSFRWWKTEALGVVERVEAHGAEPPVPHELRKEGGIDHHRAAALIAWTGAVGADQVVVLNTDRDRLGVAEATRWRVAARA
jgi:hypothetical protein